MIHVASTNKLLGSASDRVSIEAAKVATAHMDGKQKRVVQHQRWMQVMVNRHLTKPTNVANQTTDKTTAGNFTAVVFVIKF